MEFRRRITRELFTQDTCQVARKMLGQKLVRLLDGQRIAGIIVETEAYRGEEDLACHCRHGRTPRTKVMYGPPGYSYVYFTYGMHWLLNIVTESEGFPAAVLIRSILPVEGVEIIAARRGRQPAKHWTNGPAKICQALSIDGELNALDVCSPQAELFLEWGMPVPDSAVTITPRVGLYTVPEPWKSKPWRFVAKHIKTELYTNLKQAKT